MRVLNLMQSKLAIAALAAVSLAGCGGGGVEGHYLPRGDALFESLTFGDDGRLDLVFIGAPAQGSYVIDGNAITLTGPTGDKALLTIGDDGCLKNVILGTYCRAGSAPPAAGGAAAATAGGASGPEAYEAVTQEGRIRLELLSDSQARMTMRPSSPGANGMPAQMSLDVYYERDGDDLLVALPGEDPMQLLRDGRDYVATMNGETARFVRQ